MSNIHKNQLPGRTADLCPFCHKPLDHCYSRSLNSQSIEKVLQYCCDSFFDCEIYKSNAGKKTPILNDWNVPEEGHSS
jgi:hypothetical protein